MQHGHHTSTSTGSSTTPTHIQAVPVGSYFSVQIPILVILGKIPMVCYLSEVALFMLFYFR